MAFAKQSAEGPMKRPSKRRSRRKHPSRKLLNDVLRECDKLVEDCNNVLTLEHLHTALVERYRDFGLCIWLKIRAVVSCRQYDLFVKKHAAEFDNDMTAFRDERLARGRPTQVVGDNGYQAVVCVVISEPVHGVEQSVASLVRLQPFDDHPDRMGKLVYFSLKKFRFAFREREFRPLGDARRGGNQQIEG